MTDLAKLVVRLEAQTGQYQASLERANRQLSKFSGASSNILKNIGGLVAGISFVSLIKGSIDAADRMNDLSIQTGVTVENLSKLQYAAQQNGAETEQLTTGLRQLAKAAAAAADGTGEQANAFKTLGVTVTDANGNLKSTEQLFIDTAEAMSGFEDGASKSALAMALFGRSGAELIPTLNQGRDGLKDLGDQAERTGAVLSTDAARAADEFNDAVAGAKSSVTTFIANALGPLIPDLVAAAKGFTGAADGADKLSSSTEVMQASLRLVASVGLTVADTFSAVGKDFGALAAAAVAAATLNFDQVVTIFKERNRDALESDRQFAEAIATVWHGALEEVTVTAKKISDQKRKLNYRPGGGAGKASGIDPLQIMVTAQKSYTSAMDAFYDDLNEQTMTSTEQQLSQFAKIEAALNELSSAGKISGDVFKQRYSEALEELLPEIKVTAEKIGNTLMAKFDEVNQYQKQLQENTVDILADGIYESFRGGLEKIPAAFADMLLKLAIQAQAAKLGEMIFGASGTGGSGFLGGIGKLFSGLFGPGRASGGPVLPGTMYPVNENTPNTEYFMPSTPGNIIPAGAMGGGDTYNITIPISTSDGSRLSRQTQMQASSAVARGIAMANRRNN